MANDGKSNCSNGTSPTKITASDSWETLHKHTFLFGHQSVGQNIIDALHVIVAKHNNHFLHISEIDHPADIKKPGFYHFRVGENFYPTMKNRDFASFLDNCGKNRIDVAFYKLCYVDIDDQTNIDNTFASYYENMETLKKTHPMTKFIHISTPLVVVQFGLRAWVKKVIKRKINGYSENIKRNEYNKLLSKAYKGRETLFDLARYESTKPDYSRMQFSLRGKKYYSLVPEYSYDGRHLNYARSEYIALKLLYFLAEIVK